MASSTLFWSPSRRSIASESFLTLLLFCVFAFLPVVHAQIHSYFLITRPGPSSPWANGSPYPLTWTKGTHDGVDVFDVEITSISLDGIFYIAQNVPASYGALNVLLQDVPPANDYFVVCLNSTDGAVYAVSSRFSITNSSSAQNPSPNPAVPTVTVSGPANPLKHFATTLAVVTSGGTRLLAHPSALGFSSVLVLGAVFLGGLMAVW